MAQKMSEFLREHPKFMGALFTSIMLLSQAGAVAANNSVTIGGP
ncbi:hypothetical protein ACFO0N_09585 [Halobium salinum]|uniref:Uncharacterized protein n=1 Tax=Halobium salinum TaxID=1364940 RepID=A0ABD5PBV5_9EURY|nr:hypothetical protein [Halobium salinum]